jgi:hypothetical protein
MAETDSISSNRQGLLKIQARQKCSNCTKSCWTSFRRYYRERWVLQQMNESLWTWGVAPGQCCAVPLFLPPPPPLRQDKSTTKVQNNRTFHPASMSLYGDDELFCQRREHPSRYSRNAVPARPITRPNCASISCCYTLTVWRGVACAR